MPPLSQSIMMTSITDMGSLSTTSSRGCHHDAGGKKIVAVDKQSNTTLIDSSPPYCVSLSSSSAASQSAGLDEGPPEGMSSTSSDESSSFVAPKVYIDVPGYFDICCGRGKGFFNRPGNKLFQDTIKENAERYRNAKSKSLKSAIVTSLVKKLTDEHGARFIKKDPQADGRWYVLPPSLAHEKTGHAIRDHWTQRQHQEQAAAAGRQDEPCPGKPPSDQEKNVAMIPRSRQEQRKNKATGKQRLKKKAAVKKHKVPKRSARPVATGSKSAVGKRGKKERLVIEKGPAPEKVTAYYPVVDYDSPVVLVVDSTPKLGMMHFHDVEKGSISTISSCPDDHHLESFDFFEESLLSEHHHHDAAFLQDRSTDEGDDYFHGVPTNGDMSWSQPPFQLGEDTNDARSLGKQDIHLSSPQMEDIRVAPSFVDDTNGSMNAATHSICNNAPHFPQQLAPLSESMGSMLKDDPSIMDTLFRSWSQQQQDFVRTFNSSQFGNPFVPNPLLVQSPMVQIGFTGTMMNV